jgi:hypothetical protein
MVKKKKAKRVMRRKKVVKKKKAKRVMKGKKIKKAAKKKVLAKKKLGEKYIGNIEHFFGHISVAAMKVKAPLSVGDTIHVLGPHNDFYQKIDSMQINHKDVAKAKKGQDVGFKIQQKVRVTDKVFLAPAKKKGITAQPTQVGMQKPIFPGMVKPKPVSQSKPPKDTGHSGTKFLNF